MGDSESAYPPVSKPAPEKVLVPAADLLRLFHDHLGGRVLERSDTKEILAQIVCVLLNCDERTDEGLLRLPEPERLIYFNRIDRQDAQLLQRVDKAMELQVFQRAVQALALAVRNRLVEFGAYRQGEFPYFFDDLLGSDIVLRYLPY